VTATARSTSKSAVSRKFVAMTATALAQLLAADLSALDLVALMIDGVHFGESCCVVALGIDSEGVKHPLALVEGAIENATVVTDLLTGLRERGLDATRPILVGIDGAKALRKAVVDVFDHPVIQRCQLHKLRNVAMPAVNDVGEPCAGEPHAGFDGRELETERLGHGHRSGTTRRETAGTKASGPTANTLPLRQLPTLHARPR